MPDGRERRQRRDLLAPLVLAALLLLALAGWLLFPTLQHAVSYQDCIASGHNNCGR